MFDTCLTCRSPLIYEIVLPQLEHKREKKNFCLYGCKLNYFLLFIGIQFKFADSLRYFDR